MSDPVRPIDGSPPGSPVPGILQARPLEWVGIYSSNAWKWKVKVKSLSCAGLLATPWTAAYQAPPSMGFSRQDCCSGVPLPSPPRPNTLMPCTVSLPLFLPPQVHPFNPSPYSVHIDSPLLVSLQLFKKRFFLNILSDLLPQIICLCSNFAL